MLLQFELTYYTMDEYTVASLLQHATGVAEAGALLAEPAMCNASWVHEACHKLLHSFAGGSSRHTLPGPSCCAHVCQCLTISIGSQSGLWQPHHYHNLCATHSNGLTHDPLPAAHVQCTVCAT
jgi:hypothetical protein